MPGVHQLPWQLNLQEWQVQVVGALAPATIFLDSLFAMTGAPNSFVKSTVCGLSVFTSKNDCLT